MGKIRSFVFARKTALAIGIVFLVAALGGFALFAADKIVAGESDPLASGSFPSNSIAFGVASESDFAHVNYMSLPDLHMCPRRDGRWDASLSWQGAVFLRDALAKKVDKGSTVTPMNVGRGELVLAVPLETMGIKRVDADFTLITQGPSGKMGVPLAAGTGGSSPSVKEVFDHKVIRFDPFESQGIKVGDRLILAGKISFVLPSFKTQSNGFDDWRFQLPLTNQDFGEMVPSLGKSVPENGANVMDEFAKETTGGGSERPRIAISMCRNNSQYAISDLSPELRTTAMEYRWASPLVRPDSISGRVSGGPLRLMADNSLGFSIGILASLLGAFYGIALARNEKDPIRAAVPTPNSPPSVQRGADQSRDARAKPGVSKGTVIADKPRRKKARKSPGRRK